MTSDFKAPAPTNVRGVKRGGREEEGEEVRPDPASLVDVGDGMPRYAILEKKKVEEREKDMAGNGTASIICG